MNEPTVNINQGELEKHLALMLGCFWGWCENPELMRPEGNWYKRIWGERSHTYLAIDIEPDLLNLAFATFVSKEVQNG